MDRPNMELGITEVTILTALVTFFIGGGIYVGADPERYKIVSEFIASPLFLLSGIGAVVLIGLIQFYPDYKASKQRNAEWVKRKGFDLSKLSKKKQKEVVLTAMDTNASPKEFKQLVEDALK